MKVIIAEGGTANNVGSMALIENAIAIVREKHPDCCVTVFCLDSKSVSETLEKDCMNKKVTVMDDLFVIPHSGELKKLFWLFQVIGWTLYSRLILYFTKHVSKFFLGRRKKILQEVEQAEYVYCIGAERINDIYYKTALLSLYAIGTYIRMGKKLVHLSLTIGPIFNKSTIRMAKNILDNSHAIFVRDQKSFNILKEWNCKAPYQFNSYDIALLQHVNPLKTDGLLAEFGIKQDFVGVSCIHWFFRKASGPARQNEYEQAIAQTLDYIIERYKFQIVFTPTVVGVGSRDDVCIGGHIIQKMKNSAEVIAIKRLLSPVEMATLYSQCTFSIVTRMHAAILCSGAGKRPIIAINYLYKLREYMKNILCEEYSIDIDYTNATDLKRFVDRLMGRYDQEYTCLENRQTYIKNRIIENLQNF